MQAQNLNVPSESLFYALRTSNNLQDIIYPRMVIFDDTIMLENKNRLNNGVKGPLKIQFFIGWKTISVQPYEYFSHLDISS